MHSAGCADAIAASNIRRSNTLECGGRKDASDRSVSRYNTDFSKLAISAGLRVTLIPHSYMTASFSVAVPLPPEIMAPACPMRFPCGAVTPAMKPTTGFFM